MARKLEVEIVGDASSIGKAAAKVATAAAKLAAAVARYRP